MKKYIIKLISMFGKKFTEINYADEIMAQKLGRIELAKLREEDEVGIDELTPEQKKKLNIFNIN